MTKARETFTKFDAADYLKGDADVAEYLAAAAEGGDAAHFARALGTVARARNLTALARSIDMTRQGLTKAITGDANPTLDTAMKILGALNLQFGVEPSPRLKPRTGKARKRAA
jgi:probable addiction module antidote protein